MNMLVILLAIFVIMYIYPKLIFERNIDLKGAIIEYNYTFIIIFVSAIGYYLAKKAIAKDEALIRSIDRLR